MKQALLLNSENIIPYASLPLKSKFTYIQELLFNSIPSISAFLIPQLISIISLAYLTGYADDNLVGGYGLGVMFSFIFAISWFSSFNHAANVYISQAFGAKDYPACGRYFRRALIIHLILLIPLSAGLMFAEDFMILCGVEESLAAVAGTFTRLSIPFTAGNALFDTMKSFIIGQKVFQPILYIQATTLGLHFLWASLIIDYLQMGIEGAIICRTIEEFSNCLLLYIYIRRSGKFERTWGEWDSKVFNMKELWGQFKFAFSIAITSYLTWIYFEIMTLIAGSFSARQVVVHIAIGNTSSVGWTIAMGISITIITMMGNNLGEKKLVKAKNYVYAGFTLLGIVNMISVVALLIFMNAWASFWSVDPVTQESLKRGLVGYLVGTAVVDGVNNGLNCTLRSIGKEKRVTFNIFFSLYVVGLPLVVVLAFMFDLQVLGIWIAFSIGNLVLAGMNAWNFAKIDWVQVQKDISMKLGLENEEVALEELSRD